MSPACRFFLLAFALLPLAARAAQESKTVPNPDPRFKVDLLLVVAHPDDEAAATPYLARALDEHKRVAVVFGTRGGSGSNSAGPEQAPALGLVREMEARNALSALGITNVWFLSGKDTASQNVLQSLANWGHGSSLEQLVRIVRLTRPEVLLTFLPGTFIGENHGDHQAAGVLATEAFDGAGNPALFAEQVGAATRRLEPFLENLRPWQPKKIYYFPDADREEMFKGTGPEYSAKEISPSSRKAYWRMALDSFRAHQTQEKGYLDLLASLDEPQLEARASSDGWTSPQRFVFGKSLVGGSPTADLFDQIGPGALPFARVEGRPAPPKPALFVELGGPWSFYEEFRREHGLGALPRPEPAEIAVQAPGTLTIPLWLGNQTEKPVEFQLTAEAPAGWTPQTGNLKLVVSANQVAGVRVEIALPAVAENPEKKAELGEVTLRAEAGGRPIGEVRLRVEPRKSALSQ